MHSRVSNRLFIQSLNGKSFLALYRVWWKHQTRKI
jgi:hypothetical protein